MSYQYDEQMRKANSLAEVEWLWSHLRESGVQPTVYTFQARLQAYERECPESALTVLRSMADFGLTPNKYHYHTALRCSRKGPLPPALELFREMQNNGIECNVICFNNVMECAAKSSNAEVAQSLYAEMSTRGIRPTLITHNNLVHALAQGETPHEAVEHLNGMRATTGISPDVITYSNAIRGCDSDQALTLLAEMKKQGIRVNAIAYSNVLQAIVQKGELRLVQDVLNEMQSGDVPVNVLALNRALQGCVKAGLGAMAVDLLDLMPRYKLTPDVITFTLVAQAIAKEGKGGERGLALLESMKSVGVAPDIMMMNAVLKCCATSGLARQAATVLEGMPKHNVQSCNYVMQACANVGDAEIAVAVLERMGREKVEPNAVTFNNALIACQRGGKPQAAEAVWAQMEQAGITPDSWTYCALITSYACCGDHIGAERVFTSVTSPDNHSKAALMTALSHTGQVDKASMYFNQWEAPDSTVVAAYVDCLARAGSLQKAWRVVAPRMGTPDCKPSLLMSYLSGVKKHAADLKRITDSGDTTGRRRERCERNTTRKRRRLLEPPTPSLSSQDSQDRRERLLRRKNGDTGAKLPASMVAHCREVCEALIQIDPVTEGAASLVVLAQICERGGWNQEALEITQERLRRGFHKARGETILEYGNEEKMFTVGSADPPEVASMVEQFNNKLVAGGHEPVLKEAAAMYETDDAKRQSLRYHSEKKAMAFAVACTPPGTLIRGWKNLRVCEDCHASTKVASVVYQREIHIRDQSRWHFFQNGHCSCGDYW